MWGYEAGQVVDLEPLRNPTQGSRGPPASLAPETQLSTHMKPLCHGQTPPDTRLTHIVPATRRNRNTSLAPCFPYTPLRQSERLKPTCTPTPPTESMSSSAVDNALGWRLVATLAAVMSHEFAWPRNATCSPGVGAKHLAGSAVCECWVLGESITAPWSRRKARRICSCAHPATQPVDRRSRLPAAARQETALAGAHHC